MFGIAFNFVPGLFTAFALGGAASGSPYMHLAFVVALAFTGPKFQQICNILNNFMFWEVVILIELISLINWLWVFPIVLYVQSWLVIWLSIQPSKQSSGKAVTSAFKPSKEVIGRA